MPDLHPSDVLPVLVIVWPLTAGAYLLAFIAVGLTLTHTRHKLAGLCILLACAGLAITFLATVGLWWGVWGAVLFGGLGIHTALDIRRERREVAA